MGMITGTLLSKYGTASPSWSVWHLHQSLNKEHCTVQTIVDGASRIVSAVKNGGITNLVEPLGFEFMIDKHGSGPHDQTTEGKGDRHQEDTIGACLRIW